MRAALLLLALAPALARAEVSAADWLMQMSEAARVGNYQGVVIYRSGDTLESFRVTHRFQDEVERERVTSLTGEPREILKEGDQVICLLPRDRKMTAERPPTPKGLFPGLSAERMEQIARVYKFDDLGTKRIAGRNCRGIAVTPRDQFRYGYEIWADAETAVPLQMSLRGGDGRVLEEMMFTEVAFPARIADAAFEVAPEDAARLTRYTRTERAAEPAKPAVAVAEGGWTPARLPPGFRVVMREQRLLPDGKGVVEHLLISDGLTAVSVFGKHRPAPLPAAASAPLTQMGAVHAYRRMAGSFHITVVGEAPQETVRLIGDAVTPPDATPQP